ncbi:unnamed protein product [Brassica rapa subsp. trilocularis]
MDMFCIQRFKNLSMCWTKMREREENRERDDADKHLSDSIYQ